MIPIVLLHISCLINELLRYIIHIFGYNLTEESRLILDLKIYSEEEEFHCVEFIILIDWEIKNFLLDIESILQIILLTY